MEENEGNKLDENLLDELIVQNSGEPFSLHKVETFQNGMQNMPPMPNFLFYSVLHKVQSDIFQVTIILDTHSMSNEDRNLLLLWSELIFKSPAIVDDGNELISHEKVEELSNRELISKQISIGISGSYTSYIFLKLCAYNKNYKNLAKWAQIFLQNILFVDPRHLTLCVARSLEAQVDCAERNSYEMATFLMNSLTYSKNSNKLLCNCLTQQQIYKKIRMELNGWDENGRIEAMKKLREIQNKVAYLNVNVHFTGDPTKLPDEKDWLIPQEWDFLGLARSKYHLDYDQNWELMGKMRAIGTESSECVFIQIAKFEGNWKDALLSDGKIMEALILRKYFCQLGGPLWNAMRGDGFSYKEPSIEFLPDQKTAMLTVEGYNLDKCIEIYWKTKETVETILNIGEMDKRLFEEAKRSLIHELISGESTLEMAAHSALMATIRDVGSDFTQKLCDRIWTAKMDDVFQKGAPIIRQIFDDSKTIRCIALPKFNFGKLKKRFGEVEFCRLKDLQTTAEIDELVEDFEMLPEFFNEH